MPPELAGAALACCRSASTCRSWATTSGWLSVRPRARIAASCDSAWINAPCGPPPAPAVTIVRGVPAIWPLMAASELCAAAISESTLRISLRIVWRRRALAPAPATASGFAASKARRRSSIASSSALRSSRACSRKIIVCATSPRLSAMFCSRNRSIMRWTTSCASFAFSASENPLRPMVAVISNRFSCCRLTRIFSDRSATAFCISRSVWILSPNRVERMIFSRLVVLVRVWRTRVIASSPPFAICSSSPSTSSSSTKMRARLS